MIDALSPALDAAVTLQPQMAGLLPDFLNPDVFLRDPRLAPWIILLVCGIVFAETGLLVGFFLPGDSMLFTAGLLVATGAIDVNLWFFAGCVFIAAFAGDQTGYLIGHKAGPSVFNKPDSRFFRKEYVDKAHEFFERFGGRAVILARFVPIVRTFVPVIAGVAKMHYRTFIAFNLVGALLWGVGVTLLGHWLGQYTWVGNNIDIIFVAIVLLSVVPIAVELIKARKPARS
ncbi:MAG: VTT domain-containing protein [Arthrobacter sp.]|uniref:VTT domain-containing protein n=1 Tax=unclassified Arthrobacter TaxID=235627 RepID=UPI00264D5028|nr:VTT domain-containing protein [Micrococcaceae bacterium]MDN5813379.1 VTT domain-containing protein [Micrococcaceae bacterium]MDN5823869.1 VTT domain-containing protein [Micrococcaceae bacterium]MDN5878539.1 VTT domain-containing protein [Micrococcaceae bacterium]MDN5886380.1 VTT domain-containing protein [Micrococcaceae bacterium]